MPQETEQNCEAAVTCRGVYKRFLELLEDLQADHKAAMSKLKAALPSEYKNYVELADYFTDEKMKVLRKRVLDVGNDAVRAIQEGWILNFQFKQ
jgi:hypothetical protein